LPQDFFTVEAWTAKGLQRFLVLFFIELSLIKTGRDRRSLARGVIVFTE